MDFTIPWAVIPLRWSSALLGMSLFWVVDAFATWAGLAMFGLAMNPVELVYRVLALLIPMPVSPAALPTLRNMAQRPSSRTGGAEEVNEPALRPGSRQ